MNSTFHIDKLDSDNYELWRLQMRSVLIHSELWSYANGSVPKPKEKEEVLQWELKNEKALASILLCVKSSQLVHVKNCENAKEAWDKLAEVHNPKGPATKVTLFKQLVYLKMKEGVNMETHLNTFFNLLDKLNGVEIVLPDELSTIILLTSLTKSYESFVVAIESRDQLPTIQILKNKLLEDEIRRHTNESISDTEESAFMATRRESHKQLNNNNNYN
jgi:hypothetical protein